MRTVKAEVSKEDYEIVRNHWDKEKYLEGDEIRIEFRTAGRKPVIVEMQ